MRSLYSKRAILAPASSCCRRQAQYAPETPPPTTAMSRSIVALPAPKSAEYNALGRAACCPQRLGHRHGRHAEPLLQPERVPEREPLPVVVEVDVAVALDAFEPARPLLQLLLRVVAPLGE